MARANNWTGYFLGALIAAGMGFNFNTSEILIESVDYGYFKSGYVSYCVTKGYNIVYQQRQKFSWSKARLSSVIGLCKSILAVSTF